MSAAWRKPAVLIFEAELPLALQASGSLSLASPRESNQREGDPGGAVSRHPATAPALLYHRHPCRRLPSDCARVLRGSTSFPSHPRRTTGAPINAPPARQSKETCRKVVHGWTSSWIKGTVRGAEHRRRRGKSPKGCGDGSPQSRSSTGRCCLSDPPSPRSAGNFDSQEANQNTALGA